MFLRHGSNAKYVSKRNWPCPCGPTPAKLKGMAQEDIPQAPEREVPEAMCLKTECWFDGWIEISDVFGPRGETWGGTRIRRWE